MRQATRLRRCAHTDALALLALLRRTHARLGRIESAHARTFNTTAHSRMQETPHINGWCGASRIPRERDCNDMPTVVAAIIKASRAVFR